MIEISKKEGKIIKQIMPHLVTSTVNKRHYYLVECDKAFKLLDKIRKGEDVTKFNKKKKRV